MSVSRWNDSEYDNGFLALECECDGLSVSVSGWSEYDSVVLGDSSKNSSSWKGNVYHRW